MAFNHDNFIALTNYTDLDSLLQWYIDTVGPKRSALEKLAIEHPEKLKVLVNNDPVLIKLRKISKELRELMEFVR